MKIPRSRIDTEPELTGAQIAAHYNTGEATVRRWMHLGMPARKYNSRFIRYRLSEVEKWSQPSHRNLG